MPEATNIVSEYLVVAFDSHGRLVEEEFATLEQAELFVALINGGSEEQHYIHRLPR